MFFTIITTLLPVFGIIFLGLAVARKGLMPMEAAAGLNQFVYWVSLPAMMFNILARLDATSISAEFLLALYVSLGISYAISLILLSQFFRKKREEAVLLSCLANFPNVAFMGVAVVSFLLPGDDFAMFIAGLCAFLYIVIMPYTDTILDMRRHKGEKFSTLLLFLVKTVVHNPMIVLGTAGIILSVTQTSAPNWALNASSMLGATAAPCALFAMGMVMNAQLATMCGFSGGIPYRQLGVHLIKLVLLPCITFFSLKFFHIEGIALAVTTLFAGMPVAVAAYVVAEKYQVCVRESSMIIFFDTLMSVATIPAIISVLYALHILSF